ncbi:MAG TPA: ATP-binding protein [Nitrospirales bacterium]|nr:ATP-binding protein [Nitrospirales bacterium]
MGAGTTFQNLSVRHKVTLILALTMVPVVALMILFLVTVRQLLAVQDEVVSMSAAVTHTGAILSKIVDVQDGFRGFVLTRNEKFLVPFYEADESIDPAVHRLKEMVGHDPDFLSRVAQIEAQTRALLQKKKRLIDAVRLGEMEPVRRHIESGEGQAALNHIRADLAAFEETLKADLKKEQDLAQRLAALTLYGLGAGFAGILVLWWLGGRLLARTITDPLAMLTTVTRQFGRERSVAQIPINTRDEIGALARTMEEMEGRIERHIGQMEAFHAIGNDISSLDPGGLEGVLKRLAERASGVLDVDLCLVLLWSDTIGCWRIGAASGAWHDLLRGTVMIREETPVATKALETGVPQVVPDLAIRPEAVLQIRDRLGGKSLLVVPLRGQEKAFGVLAFASTRGKRAFTDWEVHLAQQFADQAAIAVLNARLYESAQQRGEGLENRLQELERYSANMAHDLKGPARRMAELASLLQLDYKGRLDERADRYLGWIKENGQQLMARIEEVLRLARIGTVRETVEPVDPAVVIREVLKGCEEHVRRLGARVRVVEQLPRLACNRVHLFQVLDNLVRNALKFSADGRPPELAIGVVPKGNESALFVRDNGIGIAPSDRERIFEPFERLGHEEVPGTGIGLAIVKKIIEFYQGRIWVESEPGAGTTFYFTLPLYSEVGPVVETSKEAEA